MCRKGVKLVQNSVQRNIKGRENFEELGIDGQYNGTQRQVRRVWSGFIWLRIEANERLFCEHCNELPGSIMGRELQSI